MTDQVLDAEGGSEVPQVLEGLELGALDGLVAQARQRGLQLTGEGGLLQELTRRILESALEGELTDHLGADRHERGEDGPRDNHRNGHRAKTVQTEVGPVEIQVPRDRAGSFEPQLVKKRQRRLGGIDEMVLSLSAKGLTHGEISAHLAEVYGASVSKQTISTITDSVLAGMVEWQNRPLDSVYPVVFIDCIHVKIRDGHVANRPIYMAIAVTTEGNRDILGLWAGDGGEGAKHWMQVLTEIKNRGVRDVLMLVCDGLTGLPDAVNAVWPDTIVQTCVVHLLRNSFKYAARQDWDKIAKALKPIYTAATEEAAMERFLEFERDWGRKYPAIIGLWNRAWAEFVPFLQFDVEIRKIVCTTNAIESVNARIRKAVRARGHFPTDAAALKCVYLAVMSLDPTGTGQRRWVIRWKAALNAFERCQPQCEGGYWLLAARSPGSGRGCGRARRSHSRCRSTGSARAIQRWGGSVSCLPVAQPRSIHIFRVRVGMSSSAAKSATGHSSGPRQAAGRARRGAGWQRRRRIRSATPWRPKQSPGWAGWKPSALRHSATAAGISPCPASSRTRAARRG
jgi:transposase-like protein